MLLIQMKADADLLIQYIYTVFIVCMYRVINTLESMNWRHILQKHATNMRGAIR